MDVKELREILNQADEDSKVLVEYPDLGEGGHSNTGEVEVDFRENTVVIVAAITITVLSRKGKERNHV